MNTTGARPKNRHSRSEENQSDGNEGSDSKEDDRNRYVYIFLTNLKEVLNPIFFKRCSGIGWFNNLCFV